MFFCFCNALQWLLLNKLGGTSVVAVGGAGVCQELAGGAEQVFVLGMSGLWERSTAVPASCTSISWGISVLTSKGFVCHT